MAGQTPVSVDHAKMQAVVNRLDRLLDELDSKGTSGSYAGVQDAAMFAQAVCSVNQKEVGTVVDQYNTGFGHAADEYRSLCQTIVGIRNAVAKTANIHVETDQIQAAGFAPLKSPESWSQATGHHSSGSSSGSGSGTTVEAPGPLGQTAHTTAPERAV